MRADGEGARLPLVDLDAPDLFPALDGVPELPARERMVARTRLALDLGRPELALRQWKRLLERFPDEPRGREILEALRARRAELRRARERH